MKSPFHEEAKKYWDAGLAVIPLVFMQKKPAIDKWSQFSHRLPTKEEQESWLAMSGPLNIGLVLGSASGVVALDVDLEDPVVDELIPKSPWTRVGKKGYSRIFKFNGIKTFRVRTNTGKSLVEFLSTGTQLVLPPSLHPDTGQPYVATSRLYDVLDEIPILRSDIEEYLRTNLVLKGKKISASGWSKITEFIPQGARDNAITAHAGLLARSILRGERTLQEALSEISHWVEIYLEQVPGDEPDKEKARQKVIYFLLRDVKNKKGLSLPRGWDKDLDPSIKKMLEESITKDDEQWSAFQIRSYVQRELENNPPGTVGRAQVFEKAMDKIVNSSLLTDLDEAALLKFLAKNSEGELNEKALSRSLYKRRKGNIEGQNHTEIAMAVIEDIVQYGEMKHYGGKFWQWKGACWVEIGENEIIRRIAEDYGNMPAARKYSDINGILRTVAAMVGGNLKTDQTPGVNFANGYLDMYGNLKNPDPAHGCTYVLPYRYEKDQAHKAYKWFSFLESIWGKDEDYLKKVQALREAIAATLFGIGTRYGKAICLYGVAKSGKSQILNVVSGLLPIEAQSNVPPSDWGDKFAPSLMVGKLLNICGELSETKKIDGARFKEIVEGANMTGQFKNKPLFTFAPRCTHWFAGNHLPKTRDSSEGFNRRWLFLEFLHQVKDSEKILDVGNTIVAEEREAIAAWAVEAVKVLEDQKEYTTPISSKRLVEKISNLGNPVRHFISEVTKKDENSDKEIDIEELYAAFMAFQKSSVKGERVSVSWQVFLEELRMLAPVMGFEILEEETKVRGLSL